MDLKCGVESEVFKGRVCNEERVETRGISEIIGAWPGEADGKCCEARKMYSVKALDEFDATICPNLECL